MSTRKTYRIAVIPGDGIGQETTPEGLRVLDAAARRFGFDLELTHYDWSCEVYSRTGKMMPAWPRRRTSALRMAPLKRRAASFSETMAEK